MSANIEFVTASEIPQRTPLIRKSKWDGMIDQVITGPTGRLAKVNFGSEEDGKKQIISLANAAKRRGLNTVIRGNALFMSTTEIPVADEQA